MLCENSRPCSIAGLKAREWAGSSVCPFWKIADPQSVMDVSIVQRSGVWQIRSPDGFIFCDISGLQLSDGGLTLSREMVRWLPAGFLSHLTQHIQKASTDGRTGALPRSSLVFRGSRSAHPGLTCLATAVKRRYSKGRPQGSLTKNLKEVVYYHTGLFWRLGYFCASPSFFTMILCEKKRRVNEFWLNFKIKNTSPGTIQRRDVKTFSPLALGWIQPKMTHTTQRLRSEDNEWSSQRRINNLRKI